jgi:hypothetical protein
MAFLHWAYQHWVKMLFLIPFLLAPKTDARFTFQQCQDSYLAMKNGSMPNTTSFDPEYHGPLHGFVNSSSLQRPLTLTTEGKIFL